MGRWWSRFTFTVWGWMGNATQNIGYRCYSLGHPPKLGMSMQRCLLPPGGKWQQAGFVSRWERMYMVKNSVDTLHWFWATPILCSSMGWKNMTFGLPFFVVPLTKSRKTRDSTNPRCGWDGLPHQTIPPHHGAGWEFPARLPEDPRQSRGAQDWPRGTSSLGLLGLGDISWTLLFLMSQYLMFWRVTGWHDFFLGVNELYDITY